MIIDTADICDVLIEYTPRILDFFNYYVIIFTESEKRNKRGVSECLKI